ncbi:MAG: hypothetical protein A4E53_00689 [Pelotomaculum sp. PtaB.Bin104]|nr:MAG: hypothetical protein A4E53_00689 [Pelotomaculum sp. PtaB.Bin104]
MDVQRTIVSITGATGAIYGIKFLEALQKCPGNELKIQIEVTPSSEDVNQVITTELKKHLNLRVDVQTVPKGTLERSDYKDKRFIDERDKPPGCYSLADELSKFSFAGV